MTKLYAVTLLGLAFAASQPAHAEIVNLTNSGDGATRDAAIANVKGKLTAGCTERGGRPDDASFEVVFEKKSDNPDVPKPFDVDGKMKCDLP